MITCDRIKRELRAGLAGTLVLASTISICQAAPGDKAFEIKERQALANKADPSVIQRCFSPSLPDASGSPLKLPRDHPWSLPNLSLSQARRTSIRILVLRVDFQLESPDNPLTTGVGKMDFRSFDEFFTEFQHEIDPTPHDSAFFNQHMLSLADYYKFVSRGTLQLSWDIFPQGDLTGPGDTLTYLLPQQMSFYGDTLLIEQRLTQFFRDCIETADSVSPEIRFSDYQSIIIFHAGRDRQNDIGFPPTPFDLLTGFIKTDDTIWVDNDSSAVTNGLFMPEQASQDNRATALNAVLAHEFGHQLGLVDLYSTRTGFTQLGDFALMDNNGFGVGLDLDFPGVFQTFGAFPVYMSAWSRAFLGFDKVITLPRGTPLFLAAAALDTGFTPADSGARIAKVPISDFEYFLIENRQQVTDTTPNAVITLLTLADKATGVIIGPGRNLLQKIPTGEFDFLLPGNGILIYHVDESVAFGDADGDGQLNWSDNDMQWDPDHRFITLVEADGFIDLGGDFFKGFGGASDYWTPDGFNSLTPNTNPSTKSVTGATTHISIQIVDSTSFSHNISVDVSNFLLRPNFPIWGGLPGRELHPIAAEVDTFLGEEIIFASGMDIVISNIAGEPAWRFTPPIVDPPITDAIFRSLVLSVTADTVDFFLGYDSSLTPETRIFTKNRFARLPNIIVAGPVFGSFDGQDVVVVGALHTVYAFGTSDSNPLDQRPDSVWKFLTNGPVREVMLNGSLYALTNNSLIRFDNQSDAGSAAPIPGVPLGFAALGAGTVIVHSSNAGDDILTVVNGSTVSSHTLSRMFDFGPWVTDLNRDGQPEVGLATLNGDITIITIDTSTASAFFQSFASKQTGRPINSAPALADFDGDGYTDMIFSGTGMVVGLSRNLSALDNFPMTIDRAFPDAAGFAGPLIADIDSDGALEVILGADLSGDLSGNVYALGEGANLGFPLPAGGALRGSPLIVRHAGSASLGYLGSDGFFYLWKIDDDPAPNTWRMGGGGPAGRSNFNSSALSVPKPLAGGIIERSFFCYPNPATGPSVTLRYKLGSDASSVSLTVYDLSGRIMREFSGGVSGGFANELPIDCSALTPGVYRVRLEAVFAGGTETAFTDLAVVH